MAGDQKKELIEKIKEKYLGPIVKLSGGQFGQMSIAFQTCAQWAEKEASPEKTTKYPVANLPKYTGMLDMLSLVRGKGKFVFSVSAYLCLSLS
jgi:hypothetical protein